MVKLTCGNKPMTLPSEGECCDNGIHVARGEIAKGQTSGTVTIAENSTLISVWARVGSAIVALDWTQNNADIIGTIATPYSDDIDIAVVYSI